MSIFMKWQVLIPFVLTALVLGVETRAADNRPNILFCIADDWSWIHAGAYGDPVVKTPAFDRVAQNGALFHHVYTSSPSCTPSRNAIFTGRYHWELGVGGNLYGGLSQDLVAFPHLLAEAGYVLGQTGKSFGPGPLEGKWEKLPPAGPRFGSFGEFLQKREKGKPFFFWLGSADPHRPYTEGTGRASGMDLGRVHLFPHFPDNETVRSDVADYYWEVERYDRLVADALAQIAELGELENTLVIITGDNGMPFPRSKSGCYDAGVRLPFAVRWTAGGVKAGQQIPAFASFTDIAPTILEAAGVPVPGNMSGRSLLPLLTGRGKDGADRSFAVFGKERHVPAQETPSMGGYPIRAIRTADFLYLRNYEPSRWPHGTGDETKATRPGAWFADTDNGPTKSWMVDHREDTAHTRKLFDLAFGKRPAEELYDLRLDPGQLHNVAGQAEYAAAQKALAAQLEAKLKATGDPRATGGPLPWDDAPYPGGAPRRGDK